MARLETTVSHRVGICRRLDRANESKLPFYEHRKRDTQDHPSMRDDVRRRSSRGKFPALHEPRKQAGRILPKLNGCYDKPKYLLEHETGTKGKREGFLHPFNTPGGPLRSQGGNGPKKKQLCERNERPKLGVAFIFRRKGNELPKRAMSRADGWALRLSAYTFTIEYIKGAYNIADPPSRLYEGEDGPYTESKVQPEKY